jgi:hypothetical protein
MWTDPTQVNSGTAVFCALAVSIAARGGKRVRKKKETMSLIPAK